MTTKTFYTDYVSNTAIYVLQTLMDTFVTVLTYDYI